MKRKRDRRPKNTESGVVVLEVGGMRVVRISEEQYERERRAKKAQLKIFEWEDVERLTFPNYFTIHMDYLATGEGSTRALTFCHARDAEELRRRADADFGSYFSHGVEIRAGLDPLPGYQGMVPETVKQIVRNIIRDKGQAPSNFHFTTQIHMNYS